MKHETRSTLTDAALVLVSGALVIALAGGMARYRSAEAVQSQETIIVIDPGHGGADGGASAADGTPEKELNLAISLPLREVLAVMGYTVRMTRTEDVMIYTQGETLRERKVSDIKNRLAMAEQATLTVSIHQNKFPQTQYSGTQVFYSENTEESAVLADCVRKQVVSLLQPNNTRELKRGTSDIYLLHRATRPIILVECGFLSNEAELARLKSSAYRQQMAFAVATGIITYLG